MILAGNLTRDPQLSYLPSNTAVCEFGLATSRKWKGQDGSQRESTCFVDCRLYGRGAEIFNQYMSKGRPVLVDGRLDFEQWETPEGQKRSKHRVTVENFQFLGGRGAEGGGGGAAAGGGGGGGGYRSGGPPAAGGPGPGDGAPPPTDDIPPPAQGPDETPF